MGGKLGDARAKIPKASKNHLCVLGEKNGMLGKAWRVFGKSLERFWKTAVLVYAWTRGRGQLESLRDSKLRNFEAEEFQHFEVLNSPRFRASKLRSFEASNRARLFWLRQVLGRS